jgi:hypothetical protein
MRDYINVNTQVELEAALAAGNIPICRGPNLFIVRPQASGNATVEASGNATVEAYENATVRAYENATVRAYENATVRAYENATVRAYENATVEASGNATVEAYENATVRAYENATVRAYRNTSVTAGKYVAVHKMPDHTQTINGGVVIEVPEIDTAEAWLDYYGVEPDSDGCIMVYKGVNDEHRSDNGATYTVGDYTKCDDWRDDDQCGGGLHFCATPFQTHRYTSGRKYLACKVEVSKLKVISPDKLKAPICFVEREVNIDGDPV